MVFKAIELSHRPGDKRLIDVPQQGIQRRWGVSSVVLDPTSQKWIELPGNGLQRQLCLMAKLQFPNRRPHGFHRRGANCGIKSAEKRVIPETSHQTRPKAVPQKVKFDIRIRAVALLVFAVDDFGFRGMHLQAARCQASLKLRLERLCFLFVTAVHQSIVRIPTPREVRVCPNHPEIERVVEKNVTQNWANHSPYAKGNFGRLADLAANRRFVGGSMGRGYCGEW